MRIVRSQADLETLAREFAAAPFVTVDTEFMRERTYWPELCLIQAARPMNGPDDEHSAAIIDPLADGLDLSPFFELMVDQRVVKVFHAARQDVEIFLNLSGHVPTPLFDTQVAAMVCGFGDQAGYETLVRKIANSSLDKSSRFTDWSRRPLSQKQLAYALGDVTHLRGIYQHLKAQIERAGRGHWVAEEMGILSDPSTYRVEPDEAWRRLKTRSNNRRFLAVAKELAAWREREAQTRNTPRARIMKDEALLEICASQPKTVEELSRSRLLFREGRKPETLEAILAAVKRGVETPEDERPPAPEPKPQRVGSAALSDLLRVLLKAKADEIGVAQRLLASSADLDALANGAEDGLPMMSGWRREAFGEDALRLRRGDIALAAGADGVRVVAL
ncbi:MAG: ribonuclease D [Neomegalonema sp.]|nr:ribonuclease D [Neomegalonema sp.]